MQKERIHYLDVLKGALILYVIAYHSVGYHFLFDEVYVNKAFNIIFYPIEKPVNPYYGKIICIANYLAPASMAVFLWINGTFTKKKISFSDTFKYGAKRLLLPMLIIIPLGEHWFCWALFSALLICNVIDRIPQRYLKCLAVVAVALLGMFMSMHGYTWRYFNCACLLMPYLFIGKKYGSCHISNKWGAVSTFAVVVGFILYFIYFLGKGFVLGHSLYPIVTYCYTNITPYNIIPYYVISIVCCISLFWLARLVNKNSFLEYIGRNSLFFFLFHFVVVLVLERYTDGMIYACSSSLLLSLGSCVLLFLIVFSTSYIACRLTQKYCPWITGEGL